MFSEIELLYSKNRVNIAGNNVKRGEFTEEDIDVIENWRASHSYILNTFQSNLRSRCRDKNITVAQRLKRRNTIFDKLSRLPDMNLARMNDVAGCRLIFQNEDDLIKFREDFHKSKMRHELKIGKDDRYNYIKRPKESGYRGIHDVYKYNVSSKRGVKWNGLLIEIQYRTVFQHAWATAVEIADLIGQHRIKFSDGDRSHTRFFQLASEMMSRIHEGKLSCLPNMSNIDLMDEFLKTDMKIGLLTSFRELQISENDVQIAENTILIFHKDNTPKKGRLEIRTYKSMSQAISSYDDIEKKLEKEANIVLVRASVPEDIRDAFRNYFSDVDDFVKYVDKSIVNIAKMA